MKKSIILLFLMQCFLSFSQYYTEGDYYKVDVPDLEEAFKFYFNEYEFNAAEIATTLKEVETASKANQNPSIQYDIYKSGTVSTRVSVRVNNKLFSESTYENGLLSGKKTVYHGNGNPFHEIDYLNGKANGIYKMYSNEGDLVFETEYKNNQKNGKRIFYMQKRRDGTIEGTYKNDVLESDLTLTKQYSKYILPKNLKSGKVKQYSQNFLIAEFEIIGNGYLHGEAIVYNISNLKPLSKINYKYDKKDGFAEYYSKHGELMAKNEFRNDKPVGEHKFYTKDFVLTSIKNYDDLGNRNGTSTTFYPDEKKWMVTEYKNDKPIFQEGFDSNGELTSRMEFDNNGQEKTSKTYKNGILILEVFTENGQRNLDKSYYEDGTLFSIGTKKAHQFERVFYNKDGSIYHTNKISDDGNKIEIHKNSTLVGNDIKTYDETHYDQKGNKIKWVYYTNQGKIEYNYRNNAQHGKATHFDKEENITREDYYFETKGRTKLVTKEEFETLSKAEKK
jgi:uncharacterized protein